MAQLTPDQFSAKWIPLLANNVFQDIDGVRLAQLITDIKDSFGASMAAVNVPDWLTGTYYPLDYLILHSFGGPAIFMKALNAGYLPVPSDPAGDTDWAPALGPVVGGAYQVGTVPALRQLQGDWAPGRLYILQNRVDGQGDPLPDVYVRALSASELEPEGYTIDALAASTEPARVRYDLATDEARPLSSQFTPASYLVQAADLPEPKITVAHAAAFANKVGILGANASFNELVYGVGYTSSGNMITVLTAAKVQAGEQILYSYLPGEVAPSGTLAGSGTVLRFDQEAEYPELFSTTYTFDMTGAKLGVVVRARLGVNATPPTAPAGFVLLAGAYVVGRRHIYSFCVAPRGVVEYYINQLP